MDNISITSKAIGQGKDKDAYPNRDRGNAK